MKKIINFDFLKGKKTYIGSVALGVIGVLFAFKFITVEQFTALESLAVAFTGISLRKAI